MNGPFVGQTPAELCLPLWEVINMHLRTPLAFTLLLVHPSWRCSLVLAPVSYRPSREGYNSRLCLGWETPLLQCCVLQKVSISSDKGLNMDAVREAVSVFVLAKNFEVGGVNTGSFNIKCSFFFSFLIDFVESLKKLCEC